MRMHLQNFERLCVKLQAVYGEQDPLVQQLRTELNDKKVAAELPRVAGPHGHRRRQITQYAETHLIAQ